MPIDLRNPGFGGWLALFWCIALLLVIWHITSVTGTGRGLQMMFETPENATLMRVVLWLKVWFWAPFLILAPLGHRLMPGVTIVAVLAATVGEAAFVEFALELDQAKAHSIFLFNALLAVAFCAYLLRSKRVAAIRDSTLPVDLRARHHFTLLVLVAGGVSLAIFGAAPETATDRVSMLTAYQFMFLLSVVLVLGPLRAIRSGRTTLNLYLRRDIAIWAGIAGLLHLYAGTVQSMTPLYVGRFVDLGAGEPTAALRQQLFIWGTIIGVVIAVLVLLLLGLSSDRLLHLLGKRWWKRLQRSSYVILGLTVVHALAFQFLEYRAEVFVAVFAALTAGVIMAQGVAFVTVRRKRLSRRRPRRS